MINRLSSFSYFGLALLIGSLSCSASTLYLSDGDGRKILAVDLLTQTVTSSPASPSVRAFPIAVAETIRTTGYSGGETGGEYTLGGTPTGNTYELQAGLFSLADGTTDGSNYNYGQNFYGGVYRFDRNWANSQLLFTAEGYAGITYDSTDNTLWLSRDRDSGIAHYDLAGNLLGGFNTVGGLDWNLALDHSTGSLWISQAFTHPGGATTFYEYSKTGSLLNTVSVDGVTASSFLSGEFGAEANAVPEPATGALAVLGILGFVLKRRRK